MGGILAFITLMFIGVGLSVDRSKKNAYRFESERRSDICDMWLDRLIADEPSVDTMKEWLEDPDTANAILAEADEFTDKYMPWAKKSYEIKDTKNKYDPFALRDIYLARRGKVATANRIGMSMSYYGVDLYSNDDMFDELELKGTYAFLTQLREFYPELGLYAFKTVEPNKKKCMYGTPFYWDFFRFNNDKIYSIEQIMDDLERIKAAPKPKYEPLTR